jgi:hypothetical protein
MFVVDAGVDAGDDDAAVTRGEIRPRFLCLNLDEAPEAAIEPGRIVRRRRHALNDMPLVVGLDVHDARNRSERFHRGLDRQALRHTDVVDIE